VPPVNSGVIWLIKFKGFIILSECLYFLTPLKENKMARIYFSFDARDRDIIVRLAERLKVRGHEPVLEVRRHVRVPQWRVELMEALRSSDGVVTLLSPNSFDSQFVLSEVGAARVLMVSGEDHFLIPVMFSCQLIPPFVQDLYVVQCVDNNEQSLDRAAIEIDEAIIDHFAIVRAKQKRIDRVFIGHGRSQTWLGLKDFLQDRLKLEWEEFNRQPTAGVSTIQRLRDMLETSVFAFLVLTAEDEHADGSQHARENVVHEVGLFQGRLGFHRAIVLLEEGCAEFSNIYGLTQIRFPQGNIGASFEEIRRVLERETIIPKNN
jgi:predicted nucleotide-binding protein